MKRFRTPFAHILLGLLTFLSPAFAQVAPTEEGPDGHFYRVVLDPGVSWAEAKGLAQQTLFNGVFGHLATITSAAEDQFIESLRAASDASGLFWIGGSKDRVAANPSSGWYWLNGEGPIPLPGQPGYSHWIPGEPSAILGQEENFVSIGGHNTPGWSAESGNRITAGFVIEFPSGGSQATVSVQALDPIATENSSDATAPVDEAVFRIYRTGKPTLDLPVFYSIHGTAVNGIDYNEIARTVTIPAGEPFVDLRISPRPDPLTVVEKMETVGIRIEPSLILTPSAAYQIDEANRDAAAVIFEQVPPQGPALEIAIPKTGAIYKATEVIRILAVVASPITVPIVDFYAGVEKVGSAGPSTQILPGGVTFYEFPWSAPRTGEINLSARATVSGISISSSVVRITVLPEPEIPVVSIRFVEGPIPMIIPPADYTTGAFEFSRTGPTTENLQVFYSVTGSAEADVDYERLPGYVVIGAGRTNARVNVAVKQDSVYEPTETVIAYLVPVEHSVDPTAPSVYLVNPELNNATLPIFDTGPATNRVPVISISATPREIEEPYQNSGATISRITLTRTGSTAEPLTVNLSYSGTATPGVDFGNALQSITFTSVSQNASFSTNISFNIPALADNIFEGTEHAIISIAPGNPTADGSLPYTIAPEKGSTQVTILDADDAPPVISIEVAPEEIIEPGSLNPVNYPNHTTVTVSRTGSAAFAQRVRLRYDGTATPNVDYGRAPEEVIIPIGASSMKFSMAALMDNTIEGTEKAVIRIAPQEAPDATVPVNQEYRISSERGSATFTIYDAQGPVVVPIVSIWSIAGTTIEPGPNMDVAGAVFALRRTGPTNSPLAVFLSYSGTASNEVDYVNPGRAIEFKPGQREVRVQVFARDDLHVEGTETVIVQLNPPPVDSSQKYAIDLEHKSVTLEILDNDQPPSETLVTIETPDPIATELPTPTTDKPSIAPMDTAEFLFTRWPIASTAGDLRVFFSVHGTAKNGVDYQSLPSSVVIPAGQSSVRLQVIPLSDPNFIFEDGVLIPTPLERMETVTLRLEPSPLAGPLPTYTYETNNRIAVAVIFEHQPPGDGEIEVAFPSAGHTYNDPDDVVFYVAAYHPTFEIETVDYYVNNQVVGGSTLDPNSNEDPAGGLEIHRFHWDDAYRGTFTLQARAHVENDRLITSSVIPFMVQDPNPNLPPIVVINQPPDGAVFLAGDPVEIRAEASDPEGEAMTLTLRINDLQVHTTSSNVIRFLAPSLAPGAYTISVRAVDAYGNATTHAVNILIRHPDAISFVERRLPASYTPGISFQVQLHANPPRGTFAYAVEDQPPQGWTVSNISHGGVFDSVTGKVKFGPFTDAESRILTYTVLPPANATGRHEFVGRSSANGASYPIMGDQFVELVRQHHPADVNQNFVIVLDEVTAYAAAWKAGDSWPTGPVPIPLRYVTRAGHIWKRGEAYRFDPAQGPAPACWVPLSEGGTLGALAAGSATRLINSTDTGASVQLVVTTPAGASCYGLEEKPPRDWIVSEISHGGTFDEESGTIRWGVFMDATARTLSYLVTPPPGVTAIGNFTGHISFDGQLADIAPASVVAEGVAPIQITGSSRTEAGVTLQISGPAGQTALIESTSDFTSWTNVTSIFIPDGIVEYTDPSVGPGHKFYRLRVQ